MALSFLSLLYLQVSYIEEMVKMRRGQFEENVNRSLAQSVRNLELVETKKYLEADAAVFLPHFSLFAPLLGFVWNCDPVSNETERGYPQSDNKMPVW